MQAGSSKTGGTLRLPGRVYLIGAGPGDPDLLTIKATRAIASADVVVYDYLVNPEVLAYCRQGVELIFAGKQAGVRSISQSEINELLVERARAGHVVARVKGGDPFIFGRGGEEAEAVAQAGIEWEVIPGISSGIAGPAYAGIPLTHREHSSNVLFVAGHEGNNKDRTLDWPSISRAAETLVIFMCAQTIADIARELITAGRPPSTPIALIRWATYGQQQETFTGTLEDAAALIKHTDAPRIKSPAIAIVGEVVSLREKLKWFPGEIERSISSEEENEPEEASVLEQ